MEQLRPRPALGGEVTLAATTLWAGLLCWPVTLWAHAGNFILAKCRPDETGALSLTLSVDYGQHPLLTDRMAAVAAMRQVLQVETPAGPVALEALAAGTLSEAAAPDPELPLPADPGEAGREHRLAVMSYTWQPGVPEIRFSVPQANPHDVLFWLSGTARPAEGPVPWRILIAGDQTPSVAIPVPRPPEPARLGRGARIVLGASLSGLIAVGLWYGRRRLG